MALQIPSLALLSGLTIFLTYFTPSTTATPKWPGDTVAEKIRLLDAVSPSDTVGKLRKYCKQQYMENEAEWKEAEWKEAEQKRKEAEQKRNKKLFNKLLRSPSGGSKGDFYKKMEDELYVEYAYQINSKYINPFKDCERDCIRFKSKWTKTKLRLEELQNVVETNMAGANAHNEPNSAKSVGAKRSATAKLDDHPANTSGANLNKPDGQLTKLEQTKMALAKLKQLDVAPSKLDNNAKITVGAFDQALKRLGKPDQKEMASKGLEKTFTLSKWETTPLNTPNITPRKFDQQLSPPWENTAPSSPMASHDEEPLLSTQKTDSARFNSMSWLSLSREDMPNKDDIPVSSSSPVSLSSPMALSRLKSWPDPYNPHMENSQPNNVMALTAVDKADIVLEKLEFEINNNMEAFNELFKSNKCYKSVFAIPSEVVGQLKELKNFNLQQRMTDAKAANDLLEHGNTSSSPVSDTSRNGTNA